MLKQVIIFLLMACLVGFSAHSGAPATDIPALPPAGEAAESQRNNQLHLIEAQLLGVLSQNDTWVKIAIIFLMVIAVVLMFRKWIQFKRWKLQQLLQSPHIITPESFSSLIESLRREMQNYELQLGDLRSSINLQSEENRSTSAELTATFLTMQRALDIRDKQLQKAEEGWDQIIFSKFVKRFAKIDEMLHEQQQITSEQIVQQTRILLRDALDECGVKLFSPNLGADYRTELGISENPQHVETDDQSKNYKIAEVLTPGYCIENNSGTNSVIIPAKVKVYVLKEKANG
jgi:molecular chaperone GrpE (heat shock protein)